MELVEKLPIRITDVLFSLENEIYYPSMELVKKLPIRLICM